MFWVALFVACATIGAAVVAIGWFFSWLTKAMRNLIGC
jgi:hypothetical protein